MEWQPIETAPRDGTRILIFSTDRQYVGWFQLGAWRFAVKSRTGGLMTILNATHWMALPDPPQL